MKMFVWDTEFLRDWSSGMGVAVAETVEEARALLIANGEKYEKELIARDVLREPDRILDLPNAAHTWGGS